jgi:hypothetical protein
MNRFWTALVIVVIAGAPTPLAGQKIGRETSDRSQIIHLKTALNHLTVIELREPVIQVATGSQSFKVEWRENKVFIQPTEPDASTNLFIWTTSERLNYELEPAGAVATMDFAVDQVPLPTVAPTPTNVPPLPPQPSPIEVLLAGKPVRQESAKPTKKPVQIVIRDVYEENGRALVRYAVRNRGNHDYDVTAPRVYVLKGAHYPQSLYGLAYSQLGDREADRLTMTLESRLPVLESHVQSSHLSPGQESLGVVAVPMQTSSEPTVLRFQFANDDQEQITAVLVR